jgi:phospholipid/cholesterol/gamma-HCH transport system permease protein
MQIKENIREFGEKTLSLIEYAGSSFLLLIDTVSKLFQRPFRIKQTLSQIIKIGNSSLPIVSLISLFTGMVLALQSAYQMQKISAEMYIASLVALSMTRELGPVLTALIVAGRCGAAISAEVGTMKVTEQIDAMEPMGTNPVNYLVVPRFWAMIISLPILTIYADCIGMLGGYVVGHYKLGITKHLYQSMTFEPLTNKDIYSGLLKSIIFAVLICIISCYEGLHTKGGAEGVGKATTVSVVRSFILIIASDCIITAILYFIGA